MKPPEKKEDWPYPFCKKLHDKFAQVYCKPEFSKKIVDVDLVHGFLKAVNEWIDEAPIEAKVNELVREYAVYIEGYSCKYSMGMNEENFIPIISKAIRKMLKGG